MTSGRQSSVIFMPIFGNSHVDSTVVGYWHMEETTTLSDCHRLVEDIVCRCGWEDSPQAYRWSDELPVFSHRNESPAASHAPPAPAVQEPEADPFAGS